MSVLRLVLGLGLVCGCEAQGSLESSTTRAAASSASPDKTSAPAKKPPANLAKVTDDELRTAVEAVGFKDPTIVRKAHDDYETVKAFVKEPKLELAIYDFSKVSYRDTDFKPIVTVTDKRVLRVSAMQGVGSEKLMKETHSLLQAGCVDLASCKDLLAKNSYVEITELGGRAQLGPLGYQLINAKKGSEYVRTQVYDFKPEKAGTLHFVSGMSFVAAMSDGDGAAPTEALQTLLDCVR